MNLICIISEKKKSTAQPSQQKLNFQNPFEKWCIVSGLAPRTVRPPEQGAVSCLHALTMCVLETANTELAS